MTRLHPDGLPVDSTPFVDDYEESPFDTKAFRVISSARACDLEGRARTAEAQARAFARHALRYRKRAKELARMVYWGGTDGRVRSTHGSLLVKYQQDCERLDFRRKRLAWHCAKHRRRAAAALARIAELERTIAWMREGSVLALWAANGDPNEEVSREAVRRGLYLNPPKEWKP